MIELGIFLSFIALSILFYVLLGFLRSAYLGIAEVNEGIGKKQKGTISVLIFNGKSRAIICSILGVLGAAFGLRFEIGVLGVVLGAAIFGVTPYLLLVMKEEQRRKKMESQVVLMLNMLGNSMRSGKTLPQAIEEVADNIERPIAEELSVTARQMLVGVDPYVALYQFQSRINTSDVKLAVGAMCVSLKTGANLPEFMRKIAKLIVERNRVEKKIDTLTLQGKAQGLILGVAPFALLGIFYAFSPDYMGVMFNTIYGNAVLGVIVVLQTIAYFMIRKISSIVV